MNAQERPQQNDFENEVEDMVEESLEHEYAVYVRLHEDGGWPEGALAGLVADLHASHPRVERVDAPEHDVVLSVDGDGLDAQGAARHALGKVAAAASARGLSGHAADVTVLSDASVWTYDAEQIATW
ncbi:hypothetical protein [Kineococcus rhizosphaerae]|uniref:Uncharacterized protein n=1 Tax=Kineococcus rhizosphaerae TaxID=559628 RepID=A0A2T0R9Y7_9ACTN|nr:hypothetical protein [Kineococcus rhizosphaerae]PRY17977.1 hypothetical protein CLV37_101220 [Kineococcus rhizosphaerae]